MILCGQSVCKGGDDEKKVAYFVIERVFFGWDFYV